MSVVHYKFKNNLDYKTLSFDGLSISLGDFKQAIMSQNRTKGGEYDLEVTNAQSKEAYTDNATQIPKNASVIIRRIPVGPKGKALTAAERPQSPADGKPNEDDADTPVVPLSKLNKVADLASANASEEDKISAMMSQAGEDWNPALYAKPKGRQFNVAPRHPPPPHYMCFRCRKPGHWIQNCPTNTDPNYDLKNRRTTGIPKSFLRIAEKPTQKGALLIPDTGQYAVPIVDHNAYEEAALKKRPQSGVVENEKPIPPEYFCPICKKIMNNAVVLPCCYDSCCDTCIEKYLLENDHVCPLCQKEDVSPASVVINKHLRQAIIKIRSSGFQGGTLSATSSPSAHRDGDQGRSTPVPTSSVTTSTSVESSPTTTLPSSAVTTETSKLSPVSGTATPTSSATQTTPAVSQVVAPAVVLPTTTVPQGVLPHIPHVAIPQATILDPRLQRPEGLVQPMAVPHPPAPVHRTAYVTAPTYHAHHPALVHPTVPNIPATYHGHISHPALVPTRHNALPFSNLDPGLGMMTEEEFYRAKKKVQERGRRKRRKDDDERKSRKKDRSRSRRDRRESPSSRRSPSDGRTRKRSRSWTRSGSSSHSSWSHSWSKSPSRSYSRSKSPTPKDWDRSRSPSGERRGKPSRVEETKKRKKQDSKDSKKRSKVDSEHELSEKRTTKGEKLTVEKKKIKTGDVSDGVTKVTKSKEEKPKPENDDKVSEKKAVKTEQSKDVRKKPKVVDVADGSSSGKANTKAAAKEKSKTSDSVDGSSKESKKRSNVVEDVDKKLENKKSKIQTKNDKRKSKVESDEEDVGSEKSVKSRKGMDVKKEASRAGSAASETRKVRADESKKSGKKQPMVEIDYEQDSKFSRENKKKYLSDDSDFELKQNIKTSESKRVVKKKPRPENIEVNRSSPAKQGYKEANSGLVKNTKSDFTEMMPKKSNVRTVKYNESRGETKKKLQSDEIEKSERKVAVKKRSSKVDLNNLDTSVKKSDVSVVRKCSISDLRDIVNKNCEKTTDSVEKSSKLKKNTDSKETAKKYAVDVLRTKEKDLRDLMKNRKKNIFDDEIKLFGKMKDSDDRATSPMAERKRNTERKRDSEDLRDIQKTAKTAVEKTKDKKWKETTGSSLPVEGKRVGKSSKDINKLYEVKREVKMNTDNLKKTNSSGDIREVSLKTSRKGKISVDKIKQKDSDEFLRVEKRVKQSSKKSRKCSVSDESENSDSERDVRRESRRREERTKWVRMSFSDESDYERRRVSRKRSKDEDEISEKSKKKKKRRSSVSESERRDGRHKKRKHKKKHKKHKHKKKSKRKERKHSEEVHSSDELEDDDSDKEHLESDDEVGAGSEKDDGESEVGSEKDGSESGADVNKGGMFVDRESSEATPSESENGNETDEEENYKSTADSLKVEVNSESGDVSDDDDVLMQSEGDVGKESKVEKVRELKDDLDDEEEELDYDEDLDEDMEQDIGGGEGIQDDQVTDEEDEEGHDGIEMGNESDQEMQDDEEDVGVDNEGEEVVSVDDSENKEEHEEESAEEEEGGDDSEVEESEKVDMLEEETEELEDEEGGDDDEDDVEEKDNPTSEEEQEGEDVEVEEMGEIELDHGTENEEQGIEVKVVGKEGEVIEVDAEGPESEVVEVEANEQEKHRIEVEADEIENEEALLADDEDHEIAEQTEGDDLYDEALLGDDKDDTESNEKLRNEIFGDTDVDDVNNDVANDVSDDVDNEVGNDVSDDVSNDVNDGVSYDVSNVDDVLNGEVAEDREGKSKENLDKNNMEETKHSDSVEEIIDFQVACNSDSNVPKPIQNNVENNLLIDDFQTKPLAQVKDVKSHNNSRSMYYQSRPKDTNSFGTYPSYDSGVGTLSSLDSMFDEFDDANYTSFGDFSETPRT